MNPIWFSILFCSALLLNLAIHFWLGARHMRHVLQYRHAVPVEFVARIPLAAHQKAADYTMAKTRFALLHLLVNAAVLIGFTLLGGLQYLSTVLLDWLGEPGMLFQLGLFLAFVFIASCIELPLSYYRQFVLEHRFGFNKMTRSLFFIDLVKRSVLGFIIGLPLLWVILWFMQKFGSWWWLYAWVLWCGFQLLAQMLYPSWIAPLFNQFTPLDNQDLRTRIEGLLNRVGFAARGLFIIDGSKRSTHGNAYFSGLGRHKRIVFFDTLLARLAPEEIEAVLAHELGHFKCRHIIKLMAITFILSLVLLAVLAYLKSQSWFYMGLGVQPLPTGNHDAMALILFMLVLPIFTFLASPLWSLTSRQYEFEADHFAAQHTHAPDLVSALVKLYEDNAATLTPDPLYSLFYDSHPPAALRIGKLRTGSVI